MTDEQLKALYLDWIEDYCNLIFLEPYPAGIKLALDKLVEIDPLDYNIASEKLSDMSLSYGGVDGDIPKYILHWLSPYRRPHLAGDKSRKIYKDGR